MGNLEAASENLDLSLEYFKRAIAIRIDSGDVAASLLANSYLCMARVHYLRREYDEAFNLLGQSEALFFRTAGADAHFMAQYYYLSFYQHVLH
jgi:tetratricopeptide (TPR) repeat protein